MKPLILKNDESAHGKISFYHFNYDAPSGIFSKENVIAHDFIKINIFVEGDFSVFTDGALHRPKRGDICFFPPMKMHYGHAPMPTHMNYYQLDIGRLALDGVPGGGELILALIEKTKGGESFIRPDGRDIGEVILLCEKIEGALSDGKDALSYAYLIEFLCLLNSLYTTSRVPCAVSYSKRTAEAIKYIEENYTEGVGVKELAKKIGVSASFLSRIFKKELGISMHEYLNQFRVLKAAEYLKTHSVTECCYLCGFSDTSHFISVFKKYMKTTPMQYKGAHIL